MKNFVRLLKYILLSLFSITILLIVGIITMNNQVSIENRKSSYTLTKFDYLVSGMSLSQHEDYLKKTDTIEGIFPAINFEMNFTGKDNLLVSLNILASDKMDQFEYGLMNEDLLLQGSFDKQGLMIDKKFQDKLGLNLGDELTFKIMDHTITKTISAIYRESTYRGLDGGLGVIELTEDILKLYTQKERRYDIAFIDAKNNTLCEALLEEYVPLRDLQPKDTYIAYLKSIHAVTKTKDMTDEEYEAAYVKLYDDYYDAFIHKDYSNFVHIKSEFLEDIQEQTVTLSNSISSVSILTSIATAILFSVIFFIFLYKDNRLILRESSFGTEKLKLINKVSIPAIVSGLCVGLVVASTLGIYASTKIPSPNYAKIIILFSIPSLVLVAIATPCSYLLVGKRFMKTKKTNPLVLTDAKDTPFDGLPFEKRFDFILFLRKWMMCIIALGIELIVMLICFIAFTKSIVENSHNYQRFTSVLDDVVFSTAPIEKDSFINYNNDMVVMLTKNKIRINADVYSTAKDISYQDNLLFYLGGLEEGECAVSENTLSQYHLKLGDTIAISGKDFTYTIKMALKPQTGLDNKYIHEGIILLAYNQSLEDEFISYYESQNMARIKSWMISFDRNIMQYPTLDTSRDQPIVYAKRIQSNCITVIFSRLSYVFLIFIATAGILELFLGRRMYQDLRLERQKGCTEKHLICNVFFSKAIVYIVPYVVIVLSFMGVYGKYGSAYSLPYVLFGIVMVLAVLLYSYFYYRRVARWKKNKMIR